MEKYRMGKLTRDIIGQSIQDMESKKESLRLTLLDLGNDGDMMDDPILHTNLEDQEKVNRRIMQLQSYLTADTEIIVSESVDDGTKVQTGHTVVLNAKFGGSYEEEVKMTIGTPIDLEIMSQMEASPFDRESNWIISENSGLGKALLGKAVNDVVTTGTGKEVSTFRIVGIVKSVLVGE